MRRAGLLVLTFALAWVGDSRAQSPDIAAHVSVKGTGKIKVRIAAGTALPCDSSSNQRLFDGEVQAGEGMTLRSPTPSICVQHTFGSFRDNGWSSPVIVSPRCLKRGARGRCLQSEPDVRIDLATDAPFAPR